MDPRVRAGLISGVGAALPTALLLGGCGPFLAIIGGLSAGLAVALDRRITAKVTRAGAFAGLIGGILLGIGQIIGTWIFLSTPADRQALQQSISAYDPGQALNSTDYALAIIFAVLIDIGVMVGCGALGALIGARMRVPAAPSVPSQRWGTPIPPRVYSAPPPPQATPEPLPGDYTPPAVYPPPPERYGLPSLPHDDAPPPEPL
jgi:hypothetical protein